jgi:hypothetical protein
MNFFSDVNLVQYLVIKTLDTYWIRFRIVIQPKMLDPDPDSVNPDPEHWFTDLRSRKACSSAQITIYRHFSMELFYHIGKLRQKISTCCVCTDGFSFLQCYLKKFSSAFMKLLTNSGNGYLLYCNSPQGSLLCVSWMASSFRTSVVPKMAFEMIY